MDLARARAALNGPGYRVTGRVIGYCFYRGTVYHYYMDTQTRLLKLMSRHGLDRDRVAKLLGVSESTVQAWLKSLNSKSSRRIPQQMLDLLEYRIADERYKVPD